LLIKAADERTMDLEALEALRQRPEATAVRRDIEQTIRRMKAGFEGERAAAYEIELYFGRSRNFMTIHDLRIEVGGYAAQIDHLILNRLGEIWMCESKHFVEGVSVNEHGEWARYWHGRPEGIPSPIEQNRRHMHLLNRLFDDGAIEFPKRLGLVAMRPDLRSLVLVSNNARISRPRHRVDGLDQVIKVERLEAIVRGAIDDTTLVRMTRLMGSDGLESFARRLTALHRPISFDWAHRFGVMSASTDGRAAASTPPVAGGAPPLMSDKTCELCGKPMTVKEVNFCRFNAKRYRGRYCQTCQPKVAQPVDR
jgi:hypothetical protein